MSWFSRLVSGPVVDTATGVANIIDRFVETPDERAAMDVVLRRLELEPMKAQAEINKMEAQHRSMFVAGARPALLWVCVAALAWQFVIYDLASWAMLVFSPGTPPLPILNGTDQIMTLVTALLGIAGMRSYEKKIGKTI